MIATFTNIPISSIASWQNRCTTLKVQRCSLGTNRRSMTSYTGIGMCRRKHRRRTATAHPLSFYGIRLEQRLCRACHYSPVYRKGIIQVNEQDNRQKLVNFRTIAEALRRDHMSHERRREQMKMLWNMIKDESEKVAESDYHNCLMALLSCVPDGANPDAITF